MDTLPRRVDIKIDRQSGPCWLWLGGRSRGYGQLWWDGQMRPAHRIVYEHLVGPISDGLFLDHVCRTRHCVNPDHLEPVTCAENNQRGYDARGKKTHCKRGHAFDEVRVVITKKGSRQCMECVEGRRRGDYR